MSCEGKLNNLELYAQSDCYHEITLAFTTTQPSFQLNGTPSSMVTCNHLGVVTQTDENEKILQRTHQNTQ